MQENFPLNGHPEEFPQDLAHYKRLDAADDHARR
jgi:hypothetical protein